jgi:hypothetical protein
MILRKYIEIKRYIKIKRIACLFITLLLPFRLASGQSGTDLAASISERFINYCTSVPWEEIYIHSDRDEYISGEDIWFTAYLIDRQNFNFSEHSRIIYYELLDPENHPVIQEKMLLNGAPAQAHIKLSDTLNSGTYTLRAYTNWMKNFFPDNCWVKDINIYNSQLPGTFITKVTDDKKGETGINKPSGPVFSMATSRRDNGDIVISVYAPAENTYQPTDPFCLFIYAHGNLVHASNETLTAGRAGISVPLKEFLPGLNCITFFDYRNTALCEKYIYITPEEKTPQVELVSEVGAETRKKVTLELQFDKSISGIQNSLLSISVAPKTDDFSGEDLSDFMILGTEYGRLPHLPPGEADTLLGTLKSNWIRWDLIFAGNQPEQKYQAEKSEHYIYGKLMETEKWPALKDQLVLISLPGKTAQFQYAVTDESGNFSFVLPVDEATREIFIQPDNYEKYHSLLERSQFSDMTPSTNVIFDSAGYKVPSHITRWSQNYRVNSIYDTQFSEEIPAVEDTIPAVKRFYGKPDLELLLNNYMELPSMEEVFFELVPRVRLKKYDSVCDISILDPTGNKLYDELPGMMIDGVIIRNPMLIANLDPATVEKIDIIWRTYVVDDYIFYGIVNVITKNGDFSLVSLPPNSLRMRYSIMGPSAAFVSPEYSAPGSSERRMPDFRNTMYWNPLIKPGENGRMKVEFWTSDYATDYVINMQGLSGNGQVVSFKKNFRIEQRSRR